MSTAVCFVFTFTFTFTDKTARVHLVDRISFEAVRQGSGRHFLTRYVLRLRHTGRGREVPVEAVIRLKSLDRREVTPEKEPWRRASCIPSDVGCSCADRCNLVLRARPRNTQRIQCETGCLTGEKRKGSAHGCRLPCCSKFSISEGNADYPFSFLLFPPFQILFTALLWFSFSTLSLPRPLGSLPTTLLSLSPQQHRTAGPTGGPSLPPSLTHRSIVRFPRNCLISPITFV